MKKTPPLSPVIQLLDLVYANGNDATAHSWGRLNTSMHRALSLAIGAGFKFDAGDVRHVMTHYKNGHWIGSDSEWVYAQAVVDGNLSAAVSYESYAQREPFIADDVELRDRATFAHSASDRQKERLHVGCRFPWRGQNVYVNSFSADGRHVNAAAYKNPHRQEGKAVKLFKITREDIIIDRAARKQRKLTADELMKVAATMEGGVECLKRELGVKTKADFDALPIAQLREVLKRHNPAAMLKVKKAKRDAEVVWLEQQLRNRKVCKDIVKFLADKLTIADAWDAAVAAGEQCRSLDAIRPYTSDGKCTTAAQATAIVRAAMLADQAKAVPA